MIWIRANLSPHLKWLNKLDAASRPPSVFATTYDNLEAWFSWTGINFLITFQICITKYWPPKRHISLKLQLIMPDRQPLDSAKLQSSSIRGDKGHNPAIVDEHDADRKTIPMTSPEFWNGANMEHRPVIPNSVILKVSTPDSAYTTYPGCRSFDCIDIFPDLESRCGQEAKKKLRFISDGLWCPSHDRYIPRLRDWSEGDLLQLLAFPCHV